MSVLVQGMEMPDCCTRCDYLGLNAAIGCPVMTGVNGRATDCPLIEVPEDVQPVVRCKDCVYRPYYEPSDSKSVSDLVFPDYRFNPCPCRIEDFWYSWMPDDDWFCAYGKRKDGET